MQDSNPFTPTQTLADPAATEAKRKGGVLNFEIMNNALRGALAFLCFGVAPICLAQILNLKALFEEFGVELPVLTQWVIQFSDLASSFSFLFLPLAFVVFAGIEFGIYSIPSSFWKTLVNIVYWLALVLVIGFVGFSLVMPLIATVSGLTAIIDLSPQ